MSPLKKWRSNYQDIVWETWYGIIHRHGEELNPLKATLTYFSFISSTYDFQIGQMHQA